MGKYFFGDFPYDSWIRYLDPDHPDQPAKSFAENTNQAGMEVGPDGGLYFTDHDGGAVRKIQYGDGSAVVAYRGPARSSPRLRFDFHSGLRLRLPDGGEAALDGVRLR